MKTHFKSIAFGFLGASVAAVLFLLGSTVYQDHTFVRALVQIEQQRQAQTAPPPTK